MQKLQVAPITASVVWAKIRNFAEPRFIGTTTYLTFGDDVILFRNLQTNQETYYRASGRSKGDGVAALAGHRNLPILAFSEVCVRPRILVLSYPEFSHVAILKSNHYERYLSLRFSETEHLIALAGLPDYTLEVWNWRLGKMLGSVKTGVYSPYQTLSSSRNTPLMAGQYAPRLGVLSFWEIQFSTEQALFIKRPTTIPFLRREAKICFIFGVDNNVYMTDSVGNLYLIVPVAGTAKLIWDCDSLPGPRETMVTDYKGGFAIFVSSGFLAYVKKQDGVYLRVWQVPIYADLVVIRVLNNQLVGFTPDASSLVLDKIEPNENEVEVTQPPDKNEKDIRFFEMIYPVGDYVVVALGFRKLNLIECSTGRKVATTRMSNIVCIRSHPQFPFIVIGDQTGVVTILSYFTPENPTVLTKFNLSETWIENLQFTPTGEVLVISDRYGDYYIVTGQIGGRLDIIAHFNFEFPDLCFCAQKHHNMLFVLVLSTMQKDSDGFMASNQARRVIVNLVKIEVVESTISLPDRYTSLAPLASNTKQFLGTPNMKRDIHILDMLGEILKVVEILPTFNQLPFLEIFSDMNYFVTWGMEGVVCIFDAETRKLDAVYFAQRRYSQRLQSVRVNAARKYAVSLGAYGNLKCVKIDPNMANTPYLQQLRAALQSDFMLSMFSKETLSFAPPDAEGGKTWLELKRIKDFELETALHKPEKDAIYGDFLSLKEKLKVLVDINEECPENEQIPLPHFNLSKEWSESIFEMARQERELEDKALKAYVSDQNRITQWIIENTWDKMETQGLKIRGIFSSLCCENYPVLRADRNVEEDFKKVLLWLNIETMVSKVDKFQPWIPKSQEKILEKLAQEPEYVDEESGFKHSASSSETEVQELSDEKVRAKMLKYALSGTSTHNFIDPISNRYDQLDVVTFHQTFAEKILGQKDMYNLRIYFNKEFITLYKYKEDQMEQVIRRNDRLRTIQSELNILAKLKGTDEFFDDIITDPEYRFDEQPEKIIKVEDSEVHISPYISPSRQKLIEEEARQLELRRIALLADDFRERALIVMMDGVLEKRWEDEIKKPPPLPECMRKDKKHDEYTKEDIRAVQDYEAQLKTLQAERDKYRLMLLEEKTKVQHMQSDMITKFNTRCATLFMLKHQLDAAVKQEELKLLRNSLSNYQRILHKRKELDYMQELTELKKNVESLVETIEELEKRVADAKTRYDQLQTRDRLLDRQFKPQFGENAPAVIVDQAYKIFKKRPKWIARAWATAAILQDIANRVATKNYAKSGVPLPDECYEFLSLLDALENVSTAPNSINPQLWAFLCQLRRHKIESEFKLKAQGLQLAEAEMTLNTFNKELASKKNRIVELEKEREEFRVIYLESLRDRNVQIVLPRGLIEIPLSGHMYDFKGAVLVHESDIEDINDIIKKAGEVKIKTMNRSAVFRRKIIYKEWEHRMFQMEMRNMQDFLRIIEKCKVTKEVQAYLKRKDLGLTDDLNQSAVNREIESTRTYLKKTLKEMEAVVHKVAYQLDTKKRENKFLDGEIARINVDVTEQSLLRDVIMEEKERKKQIERMTTVIERGKLIRKVQAQHAQILELATLLELQRLRTFPTLNAPKTNIFS